jgi:hypothetical protein
VAENVQRWPVVRRAPSAAAAHTTAAVSPPPCLARASATVEADRYFLLLLLLLLRLLFRRAATKAPLGDHLVAQHAGVQVPHLARVELSAYRQLQGACDVIVREGVAARARRSGALRIGAWQELHRKLGWLERWWLKERVGHLQTRMSENELLLTAVHSEIADF